MKKIKIVFIFTLLILLTGCNKEKYMECTIDINNTLENYNLVGTYKVYYNKNYVTRIEKEETYNSSKEEVLKYFEEKENLEYTRLNDLYGGYEYSIKMDMEKVKVNSKIDMQLVSIKEMVNNNDLDKDYVVNNKLTITGAKYLYTSKGAICNE